MELRLGGHRYAPFRDDLGDMFVSQRISKVPAHTQKDQLARVLASFERIGWCDRREIPSLPTSLRNFAMEPTRGRPAIQCSWRILMAEKVYTMVIEFPVGDPVIPGRTWNNLDDAIQEAQTTIRRYDSPEMHCDNGLDFDRLEDPKIGCPLVELIQPIVI